MKGLTLDISYQMVYGGGVVIVVYNKWLLFIRHNMSLQCRKYVMSVQLLDNIVYSLVISVYLCYYIHKVRNKEGNAL